MAEELNTLGTGDQREAAGTLRTGNTDIPPVEAARLRVQAAVKEGNEAKAREALKEWGKLKARESRSIPVGIRDRFQRNPADPLDNFLKNGLEPDHEGSPWLIEQGGVSKQALQMLAALSSDINQQDGGGQTALHHASRIGDTRTVRFLLQNGADATLLDRRGQSAESLASSSCSGREIQALLHEARAAQLDGSTDGKIEDEPTGFNPKKPG